jgi:hypothetical protein
MFNKGGMCTYKEGIREQFAPVLHLIRFKIAAILCMPDCVVCACKPSNLTADGQSASLSLHQDTIWDPRPIFFFHFHGKYFQTFADSLLWGTPSDERTDL